MVNAKKPIRIVHVEDSSGWRDMIHEALVKGLSPKNVVVDSREDFHQLNSELESDKLDDLPDILILDNEAPEGEGAIEAQNAYKRAKELGKDMIIINLLCSSPKAVRQKYGQELDSLSIPILNKTTDAVVLGFYIASCINGQGELRNLPFNQWLIEEGIELKEDNMNVRRVQDAMMAEIIEGKPGSLLLKPRTYIDTHLETIKRYMVTPDETMRDMNQIFPPQKPGKEIK